MDRDHERREELNAASDTSRRILKKEDEKEKLQNDRMKQSPDVFLSRKEQFIRRNT